MRPHIELVSVQGFVVGVVALVDIAPEPVEAPVASVDLGSVGTHSVTVAIVVTPATAAAAAVTLATLVAVVVVAAVAVTPVTVVVAEALASAVAAAAAAVVVAAAVRFAGTAVAAGPFPDSVALVTLVVAAK